jgi:hypothetical protein
MKRLTRAVYLFLFFLILLWCPIALFAQNVADASASTTMPTAIFSAGSEAIGLHIGGNTVAATDVSASLGITKTFLLESHNILASNVTATNAGFQGYFGGVRWNPDLSNVLKKTIIPPKTFQPYLHAAIGVVRVTPAAASDKNHFGAFVGGGIEYDPTGSGHFAITPFRFEYLNAPGFGRSPHGWMVGAGLAAKWGTVP